MERVSLSELAKALKVSKTLVSLVLNGKGDAYGISKATQKRVLRKAKQLNYRPNQIARGLRKGRSNVIAVVVADIANPFYSRISRSIEESAAASGYKLIVCSTMENADKEHQMIDLLANEQNVSGIIVSTTQSKPAQLVQLQKNGIPVVLIDRKAGNAQLDYVGVDNYTGSYQATKHLLKSGHRKIGLLKITPSFLSSIRERTRGYETALREAGVRPEKNLMPEAEFSELRSSVRKHMKDLLAPPKSIDALLVLNSNLAAYALEYINEAGLRIPQDLAFICFDDVEYFTFTFPPVTAVAQPLEEIGRTAVQILIERIRNQEKITAGTQTSVTSRGQNIKCMELKPELIIRRSCGAFLRK